jgi:hypothetical protein
MIIPLIVVGLFAALSIGSVPEINSVAELVEYSKCDPHRIVYGLGQNITYKHVEDWQDADECLKQGFGDCKCHSVVGVEALTQCGYKASIKVFSRTGARRLYPRHAVAQYEKPDGTRGYLDGVAREFDKDKDWRDIIRTIRPYDYEETPQDSKIFLAQTRP